MLMTRHLCAWGNCEEPATGHRWWHEEKKFLPVCGQHLGSHDLYRCAGCGWKIRTQDPTRWGKCRYCGCDAWVPVHDGEPSS